MLREFVTKTAAADIALLVMMLALAAFAVTVMWVYGKKRASHFEQAARLPLEEGHHE